jgi:hypothetical protein
LSKQVYKDDLKNAASLQDVFNITAKHYDCTAKLGTITKQILILKIDTLITATGVKLKT